MRKGLKQNSVLAALLLSSLVTAGGAAYAESPAQEFILDPMVVTAQRIETRDLYTPATVNVITAEDMKNKGFVSVFDALEQTIGIQSYSYTGGQGDNGSSTGRTYIRGLDKGTLILVNGAPINLNNYNSTAGIPASAVERIEVVKGSNSVLYGSEAMGGVINIITKKPGKEAISMEASAGNIGNKWEFAAQGDRYIVSLGREHFDKFENSSIRYDPTFTTNRRSYHKDNLFATAELARNLNLNYMHTKVDGTGMNYMKPDGTMKKNSYSYVDKRDNVALIYADPVEKVRSNLAFNRRRVDGTVYKPNGTVARSGSSSNYVLYSINFDNNKEWKLSEKGNLLAGFTANKERYQEIADSSNAISRDSLGVYISYDQKYTDRFSTVLGLRGHFVKGNEFDKAETAYLPQLQTLYKLDDQNTWYVNVGKSFEMPAVNSRFARSKTAVNDALKPQEGWTYETGFKHMTDSSSTKLAVFTMNMDNKFAWKKYNQLGIMPPAGVDPDTYIQVNLGEFRNTGVELEYNKVLNDNWQYNAGFTYQNPEAKDQGTWTQQSARLQFTTGAAYHDRKLGAGMNLFYSGDREDASKQIGNKPHRLKDVVKLNAMISYDPDENNGIRLNLYNLLDRSNVLNVSENLDRGFNWMLSYKYNF